MNAIAEFDDIGRSAFLERYGFNGARDYFVVHEGRRYASKAIAAVAYKWAPGGDGQALGALDLSGGRNDAAKRLINLGFLVTSPEDVGTNEGASQTPGVSGDQWSDSGLNGGLAAGNFDACAARFLGQVRVAQKGRPFTGFAEGVAATMEDYKPRLRARALELLDVASWTDAAIGAGAILRNVIAAIEIQDVRLNLANNLVFWQNRFGHANRDHRALLEAADGGAARRDLEGALFGLFAGGEDEGLVFDRLADLTHRKYPLLAYLFYLKDGDRFLPIQPTGFDEAFRELGIDLVTRGQCSWDNYRRYLNAIAGVRSRLEAHGGFGDVDLIDAHSLCWLLVKLPLVTATGPAGNRSGSRGVDPGRKLGARDRAIATMILSVEKTVRDANGQSVLRTVKNKELHLDQYALRKLLERLTDVQGDRCALTGIPFDYSGADPRLAPSCDRIDSAGHYSDGNVQIVCCFINFWKGSDDNDEFRELLALIRHDDF
ncbi:hypothetical protein [Sphingomonas sp. Leaf4]|uniref:hypothetical protein n=1 Tax=Sphingomonas sp. Leaf4 TaxID=2876553 RepID=UPI001E2B1EA1|nr:hypothetical protein [Sphingomonas sp. Leaf4]